MNPSARIRRQVEANSTLRRTLAMVDRAVHHPVPVQTVRDVAQRSQPRGPKPLVSVIIPCYNYAHFLPDAIGSALRQDGVDVEVIVVNDASTDESATVAASFQQRHPQVKLLENETNTGHVVAFNNGYALARGEFIVRLDADDLLAPGSLLRSATLLRAFPGVGLVYGHPRHFGTSTAPEAVIGRISWSIWSGEDWLTERCRRGVNCITTPEAMLRGSIMADVGSLRTELRFAQDMEMWFRVAAVSAVGRINGADQALHRDHAASMSVTVGAGRLVDLEERRLVYTMTFDAAGHRLREPERLRSIAMRRLAVEALRSACHCYDRGTTGVEPIDELAAFAQATYPRWRELKEWRALSLRRRMGARVSRTFPPFTVRAAARVMAGELAHARWLETGT